MGNANPQLLESVRKRDEEYTRAVHAQRGNQEAPAQEIEPSPVEPEAEVTADPDPVADTKKKRKPASE